MDNKPIIFQSFNLDIESLVNLTREALDGLNLPAAVQKLEQELSKKGYTLIQSSALPTKTSHDEPLSIPPHILVGGNPGQDIQRDFYQIAESLKLPYRTGTEHYTLIPPQTD